MNWIYFFSCLVLGWISVTAEALTITNKAPHPAVVIVKRQDFSEITTLKISPSSTEIYPPPKAEYGYWHIEALILDPKDPTQQPTFIHNAKPTDVICFPLSLCMKPIKSKIRRR